jgi:hypothetical protein
LQAAAEARAPGQLLGVGLPLLDATTWWSQMAAALPPGVRAVLNFVGVDTTELNGGAGVSPAGLRWVLSLVRQYALAQAGLPAQTPLFVVAGTDQAVTMATQSSEAAQDAASVDGLGVGLLSWSSPSTLSGQLLTDIVDADGLYAALARRLTP